MQRENFKRALIILGIFFVGFLTVGFANAQTTTTTNTTTTSSACPTATPIWCPVKNMCVITAADCTSTTATTGSTTTTACPAATPIRCPSPDSTPGKCVVAMADCTSTTSATCSSSSQRWCEAKKSCVDEWMPCENSCTTGKYFCSYQDNSGGWCSTSPCKEDQCIAIGKKWCKSSGMTCAVASSGWCTSSATDVCPAYDKASCTAVSGQWCGTWCAQNGSTCPEMRMPYDKEECDLYKGTWCQKTQSASGAMSCMMEMCMVAGQSCAKMQQGMMSCWDGSSNSGSCPSMPTTKDTCVASASKGVYWCENSGNGWCGMMPCNKTQCTVAGKYWCDYSTPASTGSTSGWCSDMRCAPSGQMVCPDGDTFRTKLIDCPKKSTETEKTCPDGTKIPATSVCPEEKKKCPDGTMVAMDAVCSPLFTCPGGKKVSALAECPADDFQTCVGGKKVLKGLQCPKGEKEMCDDGVMEKKEGVDCPLTKKQAEDLGNLRNSYIKTLDGLYTFFNDRNDTTLRDKATDLKTFFIAAPLTSAGKSLIEGKKSAIDLLAGEKENKIIEDDKIRDEKNRAKQLQEAKNAVTGLPKAEIQNILNNIKKVEAQQVVVPKIGKIDIIIPASLKDIVGSIKDSMDTIETAKTYDDGENAIKKLIQGSKDIESYDKYLGLINTPSQFVRTVNDIQKVITIENDELTSLKKDLKKDEKKELNDTLQEIEGMLTEVKDNFENFYKGEVNDQDIDAYIEESINQKLEEASSLMGDVRQIQTFKDIVKNTESKIKRYNKELSKVDRKTRTLKVQGTIRDEVKKAMEELVPLLADLNKLKRENSSQFEEKILPVLNQVTERTDRIDELLDLKKTSSLSKALDTMSLNLEKVKSFQMQGLQDRLKGIDTGANLYRSDVRGEISRIINRKNISYSKFAAKW